ncbi:MAG: hypothetical protein U0103_20205 [Candidatus Obscuribacterales bacterium]
MLSYDLDSLVYLSTDVLKVKVDSVEKRNYIDRLNVRIQRVFLSAGTKFGENIEVGFSAYSKVSGPFTKGETLFIFIEPARKEWLAQGINYWPVPSGVKVVVGEKVTGMLQNSNPGPYVNDIDEGKVTPFCEKLSHVVEWVTNFKLKLKTNEKNATWLLAQLKQRSNPKEGWRDQIAVQLCRALANTGDRRAIQSALAIRTDQYERQILESGPGAVNRQEAFYGDYKKAGI